jgi:hypothetical protein
VKERSRSRALCLAIFQALSLLLASRRRSLARADDHTHKYSLPSAMMRPTRRKVAPFPYPESCVGYSPVRLAAASLAHQVTCTWVCINAALHCISAAHAGFVAQRGYLKGQEWESGCKAHVNAKFDLNGTDVVVAGLFGGDYLPLLAAKVGRRGTVYGFEPTDAVNVSRALADALIDGWRR